MGKKKRTKHKSVFISLEGQREYDLFCFFVRLFNDKSLRVIVHKDLGGTSNAILDRALKSPHPKVYAWFDEDDCLDDEHRKELEKRWHVKLSKNLKDGELQRENRKNLNPIIIVSTPLSIEGILIRLFGKQIPNLKHPICSEENFETNKNMMKSAIKGIMGKMSDIEYYEKHLTKEYLIKKADEIEELELLLSIFD